jgi:hypothetical protein
MTVSRIKVKVVRKAIVKVRMLPRVPASLFGDIGITVVKDGATYTIKPDYSSLNELLFFDPSQELVLVYNRDGTWAKVPVSTLVNNQAGTIQVITAGASAVIGVNDKLIIMNKTVGSATTITLPSSSLKVGPVRVVDFKGDASQSQPITVNVSGADTLNGGRTSWRITGPGASILFSPISGLGYAVS